MNRLSSQSSEFNTTLSKLGIFTTVSFLNFFILNRIFIFIFQAFIPLISALRNNEVYYLFSWVTNELCVYFFPVVTLIFLFKSDFKAPNVYTGLKRKDLPPIMLLIFLSSVFLGSIATWLTQEISKIIDSVFSTGEIPDAIEPMLPSQGEATNFLTAIFFLVIAAPLCEELIVRRLILYPLRKHGDLFAVITSSLIFGFIHGNWDQLPYAFTVGILYGLLTVKANSVIPSIILHSINNLLVSICVYMTKVTGEIEPFISISEFAALFLDLCFWGGIPACILLVMLKFHKSDRTPDLSAKEKALEMIKNPSAYVFVITLLMLMFI